MSQIALGIDVGGSGIKAGLVDLDQGVLVGDRIKIDTPQPSTPEAVGEAVRELIQGLDWDGDKVGYGFPSTIQDGIALIAANIDRSWVGVNVETLMERHTGRKAFVINDADAAGMAERKYGCIKDVSGTTLLLTLGTGIGSALFYDGVLIPNTEFGHIQYRGDIAENWVSNRARKERALEYDEWAVELADFLQYIILLFSPRLIVLGGGISFRFDEYAHHFDHLRSRVVAASAYNDAGIIGAALVPYL